MFTGPSPNLYLPALVYNFIISAGPESCIYRPCLLNLRLYLRPWSTICIIGLGPEFAFTLLLVVMVVVMVVVVVVVGGGGGAAAAGAGAAVVVVKKLFLKCFEEGNGYHRKYK